MMRGYGPWLVDIGDDGRPIIAPAPPELRPTWADVAEPYPSPYGAGGEQQISGSRLCPAGTLTSLFKWAGPGGRPYRVRLSVVPDATPQDRVPAQSQPVLPPLNVLNNMDEDISAVLRWQIGSTLYEAELDITRGSLCLPMMATRLEVLIQNASPNDVGFAAAVAPQGREHAGGVTEARRTVLVNVPAASVIVTAPIPPFARSFYLGAVSGSFVIQTLDTKGTIQNLAQINTAATVPRADIQLPGGCAQMRLSQNSAAPVNTRLVFNLGLP